MLYAWMGFLKPDADPIPQAIQQQGVDFLSQPIIKIHSEGPLRDATGKRAGMLMIFEVADWEAAQSFVRESPFLKAGLYEDYRLYEYDDEVG